MYEVKEKRKLAEDTYLYRIYAPEIAARRKAGQFVILMAQEKGERIPLTLAGSDESDGTITIVFQAVGRSTTEFASLEEGDSFAEVVGPLGNPTHVARHGTVVCVGGGIGIAPVLPIAEAMKAAGNRVISILGARTGALMILEDQMRAASDELLITTDDGSYGAKGFVTDVLKKVLDGQKVDLVVAVGPPVMMRATTRLTKEYDIPTIVSLNAIMIDGTGMCGGCRVTVGGKRKFTCVDGPEFDGHQVDFDELMQRLKVYQDAEQVALKHMGPCRLEKEAAE